MSITLVCLEKGKVPAVQHVFPIEIDSNKFVSFLKDAIKAKKPIDFNYLDADKLRLWRANISDDQDDIIKQLPLQNSVELLPGKKISHFFSNENKPLDDYVHVIVEAPTGNELSKIKTVFLLTAQVTH